MVPQSPQPPTTDATWLGPMRRPGLREIGDDWRVAYQHLATEVELIAQQFLYGQREAELLRKADHERMARLDDTLTSLSLDVRSLSGTARSLADQVAALAAAEASRSKRADGIRDWIGRLGIVAALPIVMLAVGAVAVLLAVSIGPDGLLDRMHNPPDLPGAAVRPR